MKMFKLANFIHEMPIRLAIKELDYVLDAIWEWEEANHGRHTQRYQGGPVYESVIELQELFMESKGGMKDD